MFAKATRADGSTANVVGAPSMAAADLEALAKKLVPDATAIVVVDGAIPVDVRIVVAEQCAGRIAAALKGKDGSMMREAIYLQSVVAGGGALSDAQKAEATMFATINAWESAMIEKREALIAAGDAAAAMVDATWPAPPDGLGAFLIGF
ncbi:MAG: hypothetical protein KGL46_04095 [Hyphomicrobiales bacterium]|nr:hypothetical protein [Hyphomicrobiales bacterium]